MVSTDAIPNLPPEAGFSHGNPIVIGEMAELISTASDPDGDTLEISYMVEKDGEIIYEIAAHNHDPIGVNDGEPYYYSEGSPSNYKAYFPVNELGTYTVTQYVSDGLEFDIATSTLEVIDLTISGFVHHTEQWTEIHEDRGCENRTPEGICSEFYSGEKFLFKVNINDYPVQEIGGIKQIFVRLKGELATIRNPHTSLKNLRFIDFL